MDVDTSSDLARADLAPYCFACGGTGELEVRASDVLIPVPCPDCDGPGPQPYPVAGRGDQ